MEDENYSGGLREGIKAYRLEKAPLAERWKDGWIRELEGAVWGVLGIDWREVRVGLVGRAKGWSEGERRA